MIDYLVIAILVAIIGAAAFYVYKAKKSEKNALDARTAALAVLKKATHIVAAASIVYRIYALDRGFSLGKAAILFQY